MFRCFFWLSSKPTATRHRASQTAMRTAVYSTRETNRREAHADGGNALLASMYPAFKTKDLAQLLEKPLPSTANVLTIDGTAGEANSSASSILRFVITHNEEVSKLQNNPSTRTLFFCLFRPHWIKTMLTQMSSFSQVPSSNGTDLKMPLLSSWTPRSRPPPSLF
ncbi:hypothetical protein C3747_2g293 [Trypanosoma cruzi]|uniref:Uncharacterized protein n=1 Tax=Trypanosoma cruzi TaxID=5693 RepID=A0A2V2XUD0_TRYCR|nr:hypothetical protein C3747_2g293 [Trypanosoma cruzi]